MTTQTRIVRFAPVAAVTIIAAAGLLFAGPLTPPAGPVTSTFKTLTEVEPRIAINATNTPGDADSLYKITQPGSYYLTGNITGVANKHGIEITASGVTLDLNGFDLVGVAGMGAFDGVSVTEDGLTNIAVVNGSVRTWGDEGVDLGTLDASNCRVEGVLASGNAGYGIGAGVSCTVSNCSASQNTSAGIAADLGSTVSNCSVYANDDGGIFTGVSCTVSNCSAFSNTNTGILTNNGCTISNCTAYLNTGTGISVGNGCTVADCTARFNTLDGIVCSAGCVIRGNTCSFNSNGGDGAGIHANAGDNRIEGNNCVGADRGIDVDAAGNIVIRNTCAGNTINWVIAANNVCGPILNRTAPASAAISGDSAPDSTGSTHPNANFTY